MYTVEYKTESGLWAVWSMHRTMFVAWLVAMYVGVSGIAVTRIGEKI